jgi:cellobiose phosphorylase
VPDLNRTLIKKGEETKNMKYGHFSSDGLEFIISHPETPTPWINYLTNDKYCAIISQCAGGYSFSRLPHGTPPEMAPDYRI